MTESSAGVQTLRRCVRDSIAAQQRLLQSPCLEQAAEVAARVGDCLRTGGKVLLFGNGGSSTDAQHIAAELVGRFYVDRAPLPALNLSDNTAAMTAIANDYGYGEVFDRQVRGLGATGDVVIGLSTSGSSENVLRGLQAAQDMGLTTVAMTGASGGKALDVADICIAVPAEDTPRVQELCMLLGHTICEIVEAELFGS